MFKLVKYSFVKVREPDVSIHQRITYTRTNEEHIKSAGGQTIKLGKTDTRIRKTDNE